MQEERPVQIQALAFIKCNQGKQTKKVRQYSEKGQRKSHDQPTDIN